MPRVSSVSASVSPGGIAKLGSNVVFILFSMRVDNAQNSYFRYALPIQSPIGFPGNLSMVWHQQQSARMFNVHRDLPDAVAGKFMGPHLRQRSKDFQIFGRHQVGQPLADP